MLALLAPILAPLIGRLGQTAVDAIGRALGAALPDPAAAQKAAQAMVDAVALSDARQSEINLAEAKSGSLFVSGWRPAAGWMAVVGLTIVFDVAPTINWLAALSVWSFAGFHGAPPRPDIGIEQLLALLGQLLGLATLRTYEKAGGVARGK